MRWIFVGASTIASQYMLGAVRAQGDDVAWVVSGSEAHGAQWAKDHKVARSTTDLAEALADIDCAAVYISSTNEKHLQQAKAAVAAGKHIICEKPLAMRVEDAAEMVAAAQEAGLQFATNHHLRSSGPMMAIKALIDEGRIGKVLSVRVHHAAYLPVHLQSWRIKDPTAGGGVIADITVHNADIVRYLLEEDPETLVAQMTESGLGDGVEDSAMSVWSMPSGAMVMSHESFTHQFAGTGVEVHGTEGSVFGKGVITQDPGGEVTLVTADGSEVIPTPDYKLYDKVVETFNAAVAGEGRPAADGVDGVKSLAVALAVRESAANGQSVEVAYGGL